MAEVKDDPAQSRFEIFEGGDLAGVAVYRRLPGRMVFVHTEIDERFEGRGLGGQLVVASLDAVRSSGDKVVPLCPFYAAYIDRHPLYQDLVDTAMMERLTTGE